jgi:DNA polymerase III subunit epsilon
MDLVAILDTETTGLSPADGVCLEVAVVRYSLRCRSVLDAQSWIILGPSENPAESINHIPSALPQYGTPRGEVWDGVDLLLMGCDAALAHNADFDRQWIPNGTGSSEAGELVPWIDTCHGIDWPRQTKPGSSLISLALEHGLGVIDPHRALSDCLLLARLISRCFELGTDVDAMLARGLRPTATFQALVSFEEKDLAKEAGFHWEAAEKRWLRKMAVEDAAGLGFKVRRVGE